MLKRNDHGVNIRMQASKDQMNKKNKTRKTKQKKVKEKKGLMTGNKLGFIGHVEVQ